MTASRATGAPMAAAQVVVIIVSWNTIDLLKLCLESLQRDHDSGTARVIVVDNASNDGSPEMVSDEFPWVELIASTENLGFGPAVNLGAQRAPETPWVAPANADLVFEPGALQRLLDAGERDSGAGLLAPRLIRPDGSTQHSLHPFPAVGFAVQFSLGRQRHDRRWADAQFLESYWDPEIERRAPWAEGAFVMVRRAAWDALGGFDPNRFMYAEDLDVGWRLQQAGWATRYVPAARVHHELSASTTKAWGDERTLRWQRETYAWIAQRRGRPTAFGVLAANAAAAVLGWLWRVPAARLAPGRFARARDEYYGWARLHLHAGRDALGRPSRAGRISSAP